MTPDYKADTIKGKQRAFEMLVKNPDGGIPTIDFSEELVVRDGDTVIYQKDTGHATDSLTDPAEVVQLVNPVTGEVIGEFTYQDYYVMSYSVYRHVAAKRDELPPVNLI